MNRPGPFPAGVTVRGVRPDDLDVIVAFNQGLAFETEGKSLDLPTLTRGVRRALADPQRLRYWLAESAESGQVRVLGQAAVTREWSDWRDGWLWWFQSVYVRPESRRRGVFRALHAAVRRAAQAEGDVVGLRLYVEHANAQAQMTYRALGMSPGGYHVYEEVWPGRFETNSRGR